MAEKSKKTLRGVGLYLQVETPTPVTGLTVTISPSKSLIINPVTGEESEVDNVDIDGDFYSAFLTPGATVSLFSVTFTASTGHFLEDTCSLNIIKESLQNGYFRQEEKVTSVDDNRLPMEKTITLSFTAGLEAQPIAAGAIVIITGSTAQLTVASTTQVIQSTTFPKECSNIQQNLELGVMAEIGSRFKVTCIAEGIANIIPDLIHTVSYNDDSDSENAVTRALYSVRVPIPARSTDTNWTVTIIPESGTSNSSYISPLELSQKGLKTITFTDDGTGINNTTFPDNVTTLSHGNNVNRKYYEVDGHDLNAKRKGYIDVSITITASSGTLALKTASPLPIPHSSFTNISNNGIIIKDMSTESISSTVVVLKFKMRVSRITANISSAIMLSDFLTNS